MTGAIGPSDFAFDIVDVFTSVAGKGNPVAIVHDADALSSEAMQAAASWLGLPETVFALKARLPDADYGVRIFAPLRELPFAGHPAIGTVAALRRRRPDWGSKDRLLQECEAGLVGMRITRRSAGDLISFMTPKAAGVEPMNLTDLKEALIAAGVSHSPQAGYLSDTGARWVVIVFADHAPLSSAEPDQRRILHLSRRLSVSGITIVGPSPDDDAEFEVRSFAPAIGVAEDAVCGGGNASAAAALHHHRGAALDYVASQGRHLGRQGRLFVSGPHDNARFEVGGTCVVVASGTIRL